MLLPRDLQYAIRILVELAGFAPGERRASQEVAVGLGIPPAYASKIVSQLAAARLIDSQRGGHGGIMLGRAPSAISLEDVAGAVAGEAWLGRCALGLPTCSDLQPCPLHDTWKELRETLERAMRERSLDEFVA